jgi:hypothetical protein
MTSDHVPKIPQADEKPKSATWILVDEIEKLTNSGWSQEKRAEVADLIRAYRTEQTGHVIMRIQKLARDLGDTKLSEKIYFGKF